MVIPRGWKNADAVAATRDFLSQAATRRAAIRDLMTELLSDNPFARRCAADLARRVSAREPGVLRRYADVLIDLLVEIPMNEWQACGYVALAAALNASTHAQRMRLSPMVRALTKNERIAVRAVALEAFAILAVAEPELRDEAVPLIELARRGGSCAERSRARRMWLLLLETENKMRR
jgi:hypothetical protein